MVREYIVDKLKVMVFASRTELGQRAGGDAADCIRKMLDKKNEINIMFAAAPSQNETLAALCQESRIDWKRINAYHMDEYVGLPTDHPAGFGNYLNRTIFDSLPFRSVNLIQGNADDPQGEALRYAGLLKDNPIDICLLGVGENGHLAFNDPPEADFYDPQLTRVVRLEQRCRQQQVHDGCFETMNDVPEYAVTVTIPGLMAAGFLFGSVPGSSKAEAVRDMLKGPVTPDCPAGILTVHEHAALYLDLESACYL